MRILQLRFANLNSLYGEWAIDFTHRDYVSDGIFAITGPTGAGKSTILDAICLALYARTPRLDSIGLNTNEIMSRQTGACFAEVTFETTRGVYRCHWSQARARGQTTGRLQDSKHEIVQLPEGTVLETKKRNVALLVEELTGMDYDRFTRSMLLAQGRFAAFLSAAADERSPILEQITGTQIYSDISIRVHERMNTESTRLDVLMAKLEGVELLNPEEESQQRVQLEQEQQNGLALETQLELAKQSIAWLVSIDDLHNELFGLKNERVQLELEIRESLPERIRLQKALSAAELEGAFGTLSALRVQQVEETETLTKLRSLLPDLKAAAVQAEIALLQATDTLARSKETQKNESVLIKQARILDDRIDSRRSQLLKDKKLLVLHEQSIQESLDKKQTLEARLAGLHQDRKRHAEYFSTHPHDGDLCSTLTGLEQKIEALNELQGQQQGVKDQLGVAVQVKGQVLQQVESGRKQEELATHKLKELQDAITNLGAQREALLAGKLLREYRLERDHEVRERGLLARIATLEQDRLKLVDGKPCPLCGALHHPYAQGNVPQPDAIDARITVLDTLITAVEGLDEVLQTSGTKERGLLAAKAQAEKILASLLSTLENSQAECARLELAFDHVQMSINSKQTSLMQEVQIFGASVPEGWTPQQLLELLRSRREVWQERMDGMVACQQAEILENATLTALEGTLQSQQDVYLTLQADYEQAQEACGVLVQERSLLYGTKDPDIEEQRFEQVVADSETLVQQTGKQCDKAREALRNLENRMQDLDHSILQRTVALETAATRFLQDSQGMDFASEQDFLAARLDRAARIALQSRFKHLDDQRTGLLEREQDRARKLEEESERALSTQSKQSLQELLVSLSSEHSLCTQRIGALKQRIEDNNQAKIKLLEHQKTFEEQQKLCMQWKALDQLIGSYDGKKYRNFAQGLTFEIMIGHANQQLRLLTDRYLLVRDQEHPLELLVVDNYQAGEIRSTKNLSGGESFVVSLALALGLSTMASRKVRVDSLFLDEGFGTLDADALEAALDALSSLHSHGKLIGIISHVPALKERIGTQIIVLPKSGGRSVLSGPGCVSH